MPGDELGIVLFIIYSLTFVRPAWDALKVLLKFVMSLGLYTLLCVSGFCLYMDL